MALLLDVDPVGLVRNRQKPAGEDSALEQYVNDRPYVASSFLSVTIAQVFGSALAGKSTERPELAATALPLHARLAVLPCRGEVRDRFSSLLGLDAFDKQVSEAEVPPVKRTLRGLRQDVDRELEKASVLDTPGMTKELGAVLTRYRHVVDLVLKADKKLLGRDLGKQRKVLEAFLQFAPPRGARDTNAKSYETIRSELAKVDTALAALLSAPAPPDEPTTLATEVTGRIDERMHLDCLDRAPNPEDMRLRELLAQARIRSGNYNAVVIGYPVGK